MTLINKASLSVFLLLLLADALEAQTGGISVNNTGIPPDPSSMIDISSTDKGALIPRMTTLQRDGISNPALGLQIFNTTTNCFNFWTGSSWKQMCGDCDFPTPFAANNGPVCEGSSINLSATTIPGAAYLWSGPNGFSSVTQNPVISNAGTNSGGVYSVTATLNGCVSAPQNTIVVVNALPSSPLASNNGPVCIGDPLNLSASSVPNATYFWTGPNGFSSASQNPVIPAVQGTDAGSYAVSVTVNGCISPQATTTVVINSLPVSTFTFNPSSPQTNSAVSFSPTSTGLSYAWTFPSGTPSTSGAQNPSVSWANSGTYSVLLTASSNGCSSTTSENIVVQAPIAQTFLYTGNIVTWQVPAGVTSLQMEAWGAQGGNTNSYQGGLGAYMKGTFAVTPGQSLKILVGGKGQNGSSGHGNCGGGGGGTFVSTASNSPLLVAGGGGGSGTASNSGIGTPDPGQATNSGTSGKGNGLAGGSGGNAAPGVCGGCGATSGAGFFSNSTAYGGGYGTSAIGFINGGNGATSASGKFGGFGCAGAGAFGAGGGGGYSGGGSGNYTGTDDNSGGGGGGSFNAGTNQTNTSGVNFDDGKVIITY